MAAVETGPLKDGSSYTRMGGSGHQREGHSTLPGAVRKLFKEDWKNMKNLANSRG